MAPIPEKLIRIGHLATLTGLPVRYLRRLADEGLLPVCRIDQRRHRRFPADTAVERARQLMLTGDTTRN